VGGPLGNTGFESLVVRFDGSAWRRVRPGGAESYWWVHGTSAGDVWLVGEKGRITHWNGNAFQEIPSGTNATLFGAYAFAPNDVWVVGGTPEDTGAQNDVVLHWDGGSWTRETLPNPTGSALFKVWGTSRDNLYVVGDAGVIWHRENGTWTREGQGLPTGRLTTVAGCDTNRIFAVGGRDLLQSLDGRTWQRADVLLVNDLNGVSCRDGNVVTVGGGSLKLRLVEGKWVSDFGSKPFTDLHATWVDETGAAWAVGGQFVAAPRPNATRNGVVARYGPGLVSSVVIP
jgi:photosystem II stability/assembly factor-like uncharacterized protein